MITKSNICNNIITTTELTWIKFVFIFEQEMREEETQALPEHAQVPASCHTLNIADFSVVISQIFSERKLKIFSLIII